MDSRQGKLGKLHPGSRTGIEAGVRKFCHPPASWALLVADINVKSVTREICTLQYYTQNMNLWEIPEVQC